MSYFDRAYEGTPTWDIGRPQSALVRLAEAGRIGGTVLDVGCGTGENALFLATLGYRVIGIDLAAGAIAKAAEKASLRGLDVDFRACDALRLDELGCQFDTAIDVGMFHTLQPNLRRTYATSLHSAVRPGGRCHLLCWSSRNPFGYGPERIRKSDIRTSFGAGWIVDDIVPETLDSLLAVEKVHAWLASLTRA